MECSTPDSSVHGIFLAGILEWVAVSSFRVSSPARDRTLISCIGRQILNHWATWEAQNKTLKSAPWGQWYLCVVHGCPTPGSQPTLASAFYYCSDCENPRDGGAWWAAIYGIAQSWTQLKWLSSSRLAQNSLPPGSQPWMTGPVYPTFNWNTSEGWSSLRVWVPGVKKQINK